MVNLCARIIKHRETTPSQIHQKRCFVSLDAICRPRTECLVEQRHLLKNISPDPEVWAEWAGWRLIKSLSLSIMVTREAKSHDPIRCRPFRLPVVRPQ